MQLKEYKSNYKLKLKAKGTSYSHIRGTSTTTEPLDGIFLNK